MNQFYEERKKRIELNHQKLLQNEKSINSGNDGNVWQNVESNMGGSSSNADRMREAILNKNRQDQNK